MRCSDLVMKLPFQLTSLKLLSPFLSGKSCLKLWIKRTAWSWNFNKWGETTTGHGFGRHENHQNCRGGLAQCCNLRLASHHFKTMRKIFWPSHMKGLMMTKLLATSNDNDFVLFLNANIIVKQLSINQLLHMWSQDNLKAVADGPKSVPWLTKNVYSQASSTLVFLSDDQKKDY